MQSHVPLLFFFAAVNNSNHLFFSGFEGKPKPNRSHVSPLSVLEPDLPISQITSIKLGVQTTKLLVLLVSVMLIYDDLNAVDKRYKSDAHHPIQMRIFGLKMKNNI